jgi:hypothetical protein
VDLLIHSWTSSFFLNSIGSQSALRQPWGFTL